MEQLCTVLEIGLKPVLFFLEDDKGPDCWICYDNDRTDAGPMIQPCNCRGDVGAVHHDCLRRWLVEVSVASDLRVRFTQLGHSCKSKIQWGSEYQTT